MVLRFPESSTGSFHHSPSFIYGPEKQDVLESSCGPSIEDSWTRSPSLKLKSHSTKDGMTVVRHVKVPVTPKAEIRRREVREQERKSAPLSDVFMTSYFGVDYA